MDAIYVTYTSILHNGSNARFAIQCAGTKEVDDIKGTLRTRTNVSNIRTNKSGKNLPEESMVFLYAEYMKLHKQLNTHKL